MTDLLISRFINQDKFKFNSKLYHIISECDSNHFHCIDTNFNKFVISKHDIPNTIQPYDFRITNSNLFEPGRVIFIYHKTPALIKKMQAIIVNCTPEMISFVYRDNGGEIKKLGLTARQLALKNIIVKMYPEPGV